MRERHQHNYETNGSNKWPNERSAKLTILKTSQALFSRELTEPEFNFWTTVLDDCTVSELRYAFENWNRNGAFFPKPKNILELVEAYRLSKKKTGVPQCDSICRARHGKGYGSEDMIWLFDRYRVLKASLPNRPITDAEVNGLLDELDKRRGKAPEWGR